MSLRDIKDRARRDLHRHAQVEAYYYAPGSLLPRPVNVRVHNKWDAKGDVQGTSFNFGEVREESPKIVFLYEECDPDPQAVVVVSSYEAYRVIVPDPRYLQTVTAACTALLPQEIAFKKYLWPGRGRAVIGDIELPFFSIPKMPPQGVPLPPLVVDGDALRFQIAFGQIDLPGVE